MSDGDRSVGGLAALALALLLPLVGACADSTRDVPSFQDWFTDLTKTADRGDESWEAVHAGSLAALPLARIEFRLGQVYLPQSLEIVFEGERATRSGGMLDWPAQESTRFTAVVPYHEIARLCWFIETLDLPRTSTSWSYDGFHGEELDITWTTRDGRSVQLSDYGSEAPPAVAALAAAIENVARSLDWVAAEDEEQLLPPGAKKEEG